MGGRARRRADGQGAGGGARGASGASPGPAQAHAALPTRCRTGRGGPRFAPPTPPELKRVSNMAPEVTAALRNMVTSSASLSVMAARAGASEPRRMMASSAAPSTMQAPMMSSRMDSHSLAIRAVK